MATPPEYSFLRKSTDRGAWWATVHEVTESDLATKYLLSDSRYNYSHRSIETLQRTIKMH